MSDTPANQHARRREFWIYTTDGGIVQRACEPRPDNPNMNYKGGPVIHVREVVSGKPGLLATLDDARKMAYEMYGVTKAYNAICLAMDAVERLPEGTQGGGEG